MRFLKLSACAALLVAGLSMLSAATSASGSMPNAKGMDAQTAALNPIGTSLTVSIPGTSLRRSQLLATLTAKNISGSALPYEMVMSMNYSLYNAKTGDHYILKNGPENVHGGVSSSPIFRLGAGASYNWTSGFAASGAQITHFSPGSQLKTVSLRDIKPGTYQLDIVGSLSRVQRITSGWANGGYQARGYPVRLFNQVVTITK